MPGLPNGPFSKNAKMDPDSIGAQIGQESRKGTNIRILIKGVSSPESKGLDKNSGQRKDARQTLP